MQKLFNTRVFIFKRYFMIELFVLSLALAVNGGKSYHLLSIWRSITCKQLNGFSHINPKRAFYLSFTLTLQVPPPLFSSTSFTSLSLPLPSSSSGFFLLHLLLIYICHCHYHFLLLLLFHLVLKRSCASSSKVNACCE